VRYRNTFQKTKTYPCHDVANLREAQLNVVAVLRSGFVNRGPFGRRKQLVCRRTWVRMVFRRFETGGIRRNDRMLHAGLQIAVGCVLQGSIEAKKYG
jgi:hypothetical protein